MEETKRFKQKEEEHYHCTETKIRLEEIIQKLQDENRFLKGEVDSFKEIIKTLSYKERNNMDEQQHEIPWETVPNKKRTRAENTISKPSQISLKNSFKPLMQEEMVPETNHGFFIRI
mgnify:FL=1